LLHLSAETRHARARPHDLLWRRIEDAAEAATLQTSRRQRLGDVVKVLEATQLYRQILGVLVVEAAVVLRVLGVPRVEEPRTLLSAGEFL
jgi:hypothetical protein